MSVLQIALPVIGLTYIGVALGEFPRLQMNRATIALVGAVVLIGLGVIPLNAALSSLDPNTLILLFAMMVVNAHLQIAGFFQWTGGLIIEHTRSPRILLAGIILVSGVLSALFLNDTIVLMLTPLVLEVTLALRRNSIPYLIGVVTAANVGSVATITGNPQNMVIGMSSQISYFRFFASLAPVAAMGLIVVWIVIVLVYRDEFGRERLSKAEFKTPVLDRSLLTKSIVLVVVMLVAFLAGASIPLAALVVAAVLLITRRIAPEQVLARIDWSLLIFFSGLFVVTGAIEVTGISGMLFALGEPWARAGVGPLSVVTVILSNIVSNVPAVLLFRPLVPNFPDPTRVWLTLAMSSTLAGNLTLLGSVANLIVAESARARGVKLSFSEYLKSGVPITILTVLAGVLQVSRLP